MLPPSDVIAAMTGVIGGAFLFALALLSGIRIVRVLRLPQDLPDAIRFEPPPPLLREVADRDQAIAAASKQDRLRRIYQDGRRAVLAAQRTHDLAALATAVAARQATGGAAKPEIRAAIATVTRAAEQAANAAMLSERAMREPNLDAAEAQCRDHADVAAAALVSADRAMTELPESDDRQRIYLLVILLVLVGAWLVVILTVLARRP
jgi:hypothetical protein